MWSNALFALAGTSFALALHAFVTYPLSLWALRAWRANREEVKWLRPLSNTRFAICLYVNDETGLPREALQTACAIQASRPAVQVLLGVDGEVSGLPAALESLRGSVEVHATPLRRGKSHTMNMLAQRTPADVLVFANAGVSLDPQLLDKLDSHFADRAVGCVCATVDAGSADGAAQGYRRLDAWIQSLETDTGSALGANGSLFAVRAALYHAPPDHALHDMYVSLMVLCGGHRVVRAPDLHVRPVPRPTGETSFRTRRDIAYEALCVHRLMWSMLARLDGLTLYKYVSHKLMRWFSVYLLALALGCALVGEAIDGDWLPAIAFVLGGALLWTLGKRFRLPPFAQAFDALSALGGAGLGAAMAWLRPH
jgi:hypothetical protein